MKIRVKTRDVEKLATRLARKSTERAREATRAAGKRIREHQLMLVSCDLRTLKGGLRA